MSYSKENELRLLDYLFDNCLTESGEWKNGYNNLPPMIRHILNKYHNFSGGSYRTHVKMELEKYDAIR